MHFFHLFAFATLIKQATGQHYSFGFNNGQSDSTDLRFHQSNFGSIKQQTNTKAMGTDDFNVLVEKFLNWDICTLAIYNDSFTPMNELVPKDTIFLTVSPTEKLDNSSLTCKSKTIVRTSTINAGKQTVFFPLIFSVFFDISDDWEYKICSNTTDEDLSFRLSAAEEKNVKYNNATYKALLYADIDGTPLQPSFFYDTREYYYGACPDNKTKTTEALFNAIGAPLGDICDGDEPFAPIDGLDAFPRLGWFVTDTREWADGESHTYEFGDLNVCYTAKYVLTAKDTTDKKCGLFGFGFFCLFKWLKNIFS